MIKIRRAKKEDIKSYLYLKRQSDKDYAKIINKKLKPECNKSFKKHFNKIISSKKDLLLFAKENSNLIAYIHGTFYICEYGKSGYVEDIFVLKEFRDKGIATALIEEFIKLLKKKKIKNIHLSVNIKNKNAIKLYKNLGFKLYHYDLRKELR